MFARTSFWFLIQVQVFVRTPHGSVLIINQKKGREDLRDIPVVTIDGEDSRNLDDALSLRMDGDDYVLGVHIADVTSSWSMTSGAAVRSTAGIRRASKSRPTRASSLRKPLKQLKKTSDRENGTARMSNLHRNCVWRSGE